MVQEKRLELLVFELGLGTGENGSLFQIVQQDLPVVGVVFVSSNEEHFVGISGGTNHCILDTFIKPELNDNPEILLLIEGLYFGRSARALSEPSEDENLIFVNNRMGSTSSNIERGDFSPLPFSERKSLTSLEKSFFVVVVSPSANSENVVLPSNHGKAVATVGHGGEISD